MKRTFSLIVGVIIVLLIATSLMAANPAYPTKQISIIVAFAAGGTADINARAAAVILEKSLGVSVIVVNKPGGGSLIASNESVHGTKPDGYTLWYGTWSPFLLAPHLKMVDYQMDAFKPVCNLTDTPMVLTVRANASYKTFEEFIAYAKANPGKVKAGTLGAANSISLLFTMLMNQANTQITLVPYSGGAETSVALLRGDVDAVIQNPIELREYVNNGQFRYLAHFGATRTKLLPNVPTVKEKGFNITDVSAYKGVYVPKGTPDYIVDILADAFKKVASDSSFLDLMAKTEQEATWESASDLLKKDTNVNEIFKAAVKAAGL